jgi:RHS repeat-associated protein
VNWTYDNLYRLTSETVSSSPDGRNGFLGYTYDSVGNRQTRSSTLTGINNQAYSGLYDANDRFTNDTYDNNGNPIASGSDSYQYNAENKLISANVNGKNISVVYDGDGNRIQKTVDGVTTTYLVDTNNLTGYSQVLEEKRAGILVKAYIYGLDLVACRDIPAAKTYYFGYDGQGSVRYLTDSDGNVTDTYDYDAFGNLISKTGSTDNNYLYTGEQWDNDLEMYFLRARYMDTDSGRFWGMDSWEGSNESPLSLHKYTYCENNPANHTDYSGMFMGSYVDAVAANTIRGVLTKVNVKVASSAIVSGLLALRNIPTRFYHYTTRVGFVLIQSSGMVGLWGHKNFYSPTEYTFAFEAKKKLALPRTPEVRIELTLSLNLDCLIGPYPVLQNYGEPGGGWEYMTLFAVPYLNRSPNYFFLW